MKDLYKICVIFYARILKKMSFFCRCWPNLRTMPQGRTCILRGHLRPRRLPSSTLPSGLARSATRPVLTTSTPRTTGSRQPLQQPRPPLLPPQLQQDIHTITLDQRSVFQFHFHFTPSFIFLPRLFLNFPLPLTNSEKLSTEHGSCKNNDLITDLNNHKNLILILHSHKQVLIEKSATQIQRGVQKNLNFNVL